MKIIKDEIATLKRGRRVTVELAPGEVLKSVMEHKCYKLGGQVDDVVVGSVIAEMAPVYWCSITQKWEDV